MSDFANIMGNWPKDPETRRNRIAATRDTYGEGSLTLAEATILDDTIAQAVSDCARTVGTAIDGLSPKLQADIVPLIFNRVAESIGLLGATMALIAIGVEGPTGGCDCDVCKTKLALRDEMLAIEQRIISGGGIQ